MKRRNFLQQSSSYIIGLGLIAPYACKQTKPTGTTPVSPFVDEFEFNEWTIAQVQQAFKNKKLTCRQLVHAYLDRIEAIDNNGPAINSIIEVNPDALAIAENLDKEMAAGNSRGPMHGIPVILKDNIDTHDKMPTTAGSRAMIGSKPLQDSSVAQQLRAAGAVILAKANLSEWANFRGEDSTSGWSGHGGLSKNPYILDRNTCGSSAGSGSSVSANLCMVAIGTETNGSIVCPSTTNGIVGIKPTVGLVSRSGIIPISFTQDTAGPMARTVSDAASCLGALTGVDNLDSKTLVGSRKALTDYTPFLKEDGLRGKRIAYLTTMKGRSQEVDQLIAQTIADMKAQGATVIEIDKISEENVGRDSFNIMLFEYKDGLNKYFASLGPNAPIKSLDELIEFNKKDEIELKHFGQEYLIMANEKGDLNSEEYKTSLERMLKESRQNGIDRVMNEHNLDAIIAPTGSPAWKTDLVNGDKFHIGSSSPAARAGYPNITVPMGFVGELPVGISIFGRAWSEGKLIEIAYAYEQATKHRKAPRFLEE